MPNHRKNAVTQQLAQDRAHRGCSARRESTIETRDDPHRPVEQPPLRRYHGSIGVFKPQTVGPGRLPRTRKANLQHYSDEFVFPPKRAPWPLRRRSEKPRWTDQLGNRKSTLAEVSKRRTSPNVANPSGLVDPCK